MKISKVNHVKAGVGKTKENANGILYSYPSKRKSENKNLSEHIHRVCQKTQVLYNVFVPMKAVARNEKILYKSIMDNFKMVIKKTVLDNWTTETDPDMVIKKQLDDLKNVQNKNILYNRREGKSSSVAEQYYSFGKRKQTEVVHEIVMSFLRNSLRKKVRTKDGKEVYAPDIIEKMIYAMCQNRNYKQKFEKIPEAELCAVLALINEDYGKTKQIEKIVKSIEQQNVKVQYDKTEDKLCLSSAGNNKKQYIFDFLKKYAEADESGRKQMLIHIRQLIILYYCGTERYEDTHSGGILEWSFGSFKEDVSTNFSDTVMELINEKAQISKKEKGQYRSLSDQIKNELKQTITRKYREAVALLDLEPEDVFWLQHFEKCAEKLLTSKADISPQKLSTAYLCEQTWKEWIAYIAMKYVDMGKAVYHFAMPNLKEIKGQKEVEIGKVQTDYTDGLTSFDYERIKADETLERELSRYITFAVNNFSRAVLKYEVSVQDGKEDILLIKDTALLKEALNRRILQFFGGKSTWKGSLLEDCDDKQLFEAIKQELACVRNSSFHYTAKRAQGKNRQNELVERMFLKEYDEIGAIYRKKYYSNNVPMFYSVDNITKLMDRLYNAPKSRPAQIPAFNKIISKSVLPEVILRFVEVKSLSKITSNDVAGSVGEKYRGALFFLLKEIYYYDFLQAEDVKDRFLNALVKQKQKEKDLYKKRAIDNFEQRIKEINGEHVSFGEICQQLMTDFEQQNQKKEKKKAGYTKKVSQGDGSLKEVLVKEEDTTVIYKHFKMLLYISIKEAFLTYLREEQNKEVFEFLREPALRENEFKNLSEEEFCTGWTANTFDILKDGMGETAEISAWYVTAHFLNPKQLNHLIGCVKSYIQYVENVDKRSEYTGNRIGSDTLDKINQYRRLLVILEFCILFCGRISNVLTDYYEDEEDYAQHLAQFVSWNKKDAHDASSLKAFCEHPISNGSRDGKIGIYYDGQNPIVNRNVVMAMLYGNEKLLSRCMAPITEPEIVNYYTTMDRLSAVFRKGSCQDETEQKEVKEFQNLKNRIELVDVMILSEIVSDLMSQLISWAYLRERDLMYMQLGFYYIKLFHTGSVDKDSFLRKLSGEDIDIIDGAVLYQIVAMYSYDLPVYGLNKTGEAQLPDKEFPTGKNVMRFVNEYCGKDEGIYEAGLCFFENVKEHGDIVKLRNYVDHFKYYSKMDNSIMDLYSQIYDNFFEYDLKLKKSVSYIFKNILLRYFVIADINFEKSQEEKILTKRTTQIVIKGDELKSDIFTYKLSNEREVKNQQKLKHFDSALVYARNEKFLSQLMNILHYKMRK